MPMDVDLERGNASIEEHEQQQGSGTLTPSTLRSQDHDLTALSTPSVLSLENVAKTLEKVEVVEVEDHPETELSRLPDQLGSDLTRKLRYQYASSYRKVFAVIFTINMAVFLALMIAYRGNPDSRAVGDAASANLLTCILFRQEEFVNMCYEIWTAAPHSWPLSIRKRLAKVFHYGGCHSGAGTAAVVWYMLYTALVTKEYVQEPATDVLVNLVCSWLLVACFLVILTAAHPRLRVRYHDRFEAFHRFAGWTALASFWAHNIFAALVVAREESSTLGEVLVSSPNFWFICVTTCCTLLSWSRLRRHAVYPERLSEHATRLHFKHRGMPPFYGIKLSDRPLLEWHAFATIPDVDAAGRVDGFSVVVSNAGDWTRKQIGDDDDDDDDAAAAAGRRLWIRGAPLHGLLYTSRLFRRIVVVATGSGIGPCLSLLFADVTPRRVLWSTREPEKTYGARVVAAVRKADPRALIWNTSERGYPDIVRETYNLVAESDAEAVFVISNPKVTAKVVFGMQTRGIAAFGAIFDS